MDADTRNWLAQQGVHLPESADPDFCPECDHPWRQHTDKYGCEFEPGDREDSDIGWRAMPPCGCALRKTER